MLKQLRSCLGIIALMAALGPAPAPAQTPLFSTAPMPTRMTVPPIGIGPASAGEVVVRFPAGLDADQGRQLITALGCQIRDRDPNSGYALVKARDGRVADLLSVLARRPEVLHAEPSYLLRALAGESLYDPYQWYLFDRGTPSGRAVSQFGIQASAAWKHSRGEGVTVAVLDTGLAYEDYEEYFRAPAFTDTRVVPGYDFVNNDAHPNDDVGHGTHVAGTLAGNLVNGSGAVGVAPDVELMPVKVLGADGYGSDYAIARGIRWAVDHGASVINMSLGGEGAGTVLSDAVRYAASRDCVLIAAAGNDNAPEVGYPAYYSDCVAVGATQFDGVRAPYSNRGRRLYVVAPGGNLRQDLNGDRRPDGIIAQTFERRRGYDSFDYFYPYAGTSMAAPQVAGVVALMRAANPLLTSLEIRLILRDTALHLGSEGRNVYYGYGLVDALAAVEAALAPP